MQAVKIFHKNPPVLFIHVISYMLPVLLSCKKGG